VDFVKLDSKEMHRVAEKGQVLAFEKDKGK